MSQPVDSSVSPGRRRALVLLVNTAVAAIGGALSALLGVFALKPAAAASRDRWIRAGALADLEPSVPAVRVLVVPRVDGWYRERARETVFLVWDGDRTIRALSATCTHLGCRVSWDVDEQLIRCPCHGGIYDREGVVKSGPPPAPLSRLTTKVDGDQILVQV